jgi:hypothetical protein
LLQGMASYAEAVVPSVDADRPIVNREHFFTSSMSSR